MTKLSEEFLSDLPASLPRPEYDRSRLTTGIVHFGVGGFHRAHEAMYLDRLMNQGKALDWAICGVGVLPSDAAMKTVMDSQDCLYTLVLKHPDGVREARVIGSIAQYLYAPEDPEAVIEKMAAPATRIVSLTITEGGYNISDTTGEFDAGAPEIAADLLPGAVPATVFGLVTEALRRRRSRGLEPFTVMSCDNLPGNGEVARKAFGEFARLLDPELGEWVQESVPFPSSMVDRITPATTDADRTSIAAEFGVEDAWPVVAEDFAQWALEDDFPQGRPPWEDAGVSMAADVEPYERMKLRLLNCGHQGLAYLGYLAGYRYVHEAVRDPQLAQFLLEYMDREATPTLLPVPGVDLDAYKLRLLQRFGNEHVRDTLARLCAESSDRIPKWLVPVVRDNIAAGGEVSRSATIIAAWARYAEGVDEAGVPIRVVDNHRDEVMAVAARNREDPLAFVSQQHFFANLAREPRFTDPYLAALDTLHRSGAKAAIAERVD
ncbi:MULTISPECIES: mannitol dehydrogenase family protein [unclassified Arthrobacter]|uniref:mannitol dehydrogenase family protein n=1 Tax=unclassified Arthrobacter TaxID=235627 RepID=UPI001E2D6C1B|nr:MULTISPECIES: mannitol dehydrogenase family protein [unclassified Arthrobacter]MCC9144376.1 mannitol dehydrogenase family protein [Arthrobacter sp. zg-Y919]MDK1275602.1 mannitol dehydrogenase family protein [Arthrobacter sp. zg.Y919]MDM7991234.1 mannitol dehydrogenase family protein [Arthrobacter sp. zg-Y877]WIB03029.1 mannitol dehydrogenase family protein [Arthrobacter sp. zg-Y919]